MHQEFNEANKVHINRDDKGNAKDLIHNEDRFVSQANTPQQAATEYLSKYGGLLGITSEETGNLTLAAEKEVGDSTSELRLDKEMRQFDTTTVAYQQTHFGLPVWHAGVTVHMKGKPYEVISSQSTRHSDVDAKRPSAAVLAKVKKVSAATLKKQLGLSGANTGFDLKTLAVENVTLIIYRYKSPARQIVPETPSDPNSLVAYSQPTLPLPPVSKNIEENRHYVSAEVHFALAPSGQEPLHWVAILEAETLSVLYVRAFVDNVNGQVFQDDPMTTNGGPLPSASNASLNAVRISVPIQGLTPSSPQSLTGNLVRLLDVEAPVVASPTEPAATDFNFNSRTNQFAAVNAYYHCDRFFRLMQSLGFSLSSFFGAGTAFPSTVDHRGSMNTTNGIEINAHCVGTGGGLGIQKTTFALADTGDTVNPIGIACDYRVVLHELGGHGVLYPHVHSPNFGFAHSAGDSVAAITCDPDTHAPDRFVTFPWVNIGRRHDRTPAAGWGWSGTIALNPFSGSDPGGYNNEQILCTTMFRFYRSIGGDSTSLGMRQFASRYAMYLILRAINSVTPATNPSNAAGFATALITADLGDWTSEGQAGGAYGKVIRWAFEKQGLYQPAGTPTPNNSAGAPPAVDVYIDDGRHGEYQYQPNHWSCQNIWNRRHNDGGTTHEEPIVGQKNFAYVKIKNRGSQVATNVIVKAYHANPAAGLVYPNDWHAMNTAQLAAPNVAGNNAAEITVGPFKWVPTAIGHECMFMVVSATGDPSNISNMTAGDSIPEWRLVPNDNNIGQRNVFPVAGGGGLKGLIASLDGTKILVKNPNREAAKITVNVVLPRFLAATNWGVTFDNPGAGAFALNAGETKTVVLRLNAGKDFTRKDVVKAKTDAVIHFEAYANGIPIGGMSYTLDPDVTSSSKLKESTGKVRSNSSSRKRAGAGKASAGKSPRRPSAKK